jgi:uncharacterized protein
VAFYLDTSFIGPLFVPEPDSQSVEAWLREREAATLYVSDWQGVEFASSLARRVRMGQLPATRADAIFDRFRQWQAESCRNLAPDAADYEHAAAIIRNYETGLRAGDALHLAIAYNNAIPEIATLDRGMAAAAGMLGFSIAAI